MHYISCITHRTQMEDVMTSHEKNDMIDKNHQVCKTAILRAYESCDTSKRN